MDNWIIQKEVFRYVEMSSDQVVIVQSNLESLIVNGGPCSGKTITAIMKARTLGIGNRRCLYITATTLSQKYVKQLFYDLRLSMHDCITYNEIENNPKRYDVVILDDSHRYSLDQIQALVSKAEYLLLFGDYTHSLHNTTSNTTIGELVHTLHCKVFNLYPCHIATKSYIRLIPNCFEPLGQSKTTNEIPYIVKFNSLEEQCIAVKQIIESHRLDNVAILCYTRALVRSINEIFGKFRWPIEAYLPGKDGIDTFDVTSKKPKVITIASSFGLHFESVFVIGFDSKLVWKNPEDALKTIVTRPTKNLFIFYENQLPEPLASISQEFYKICVGNNDIDFRF